MTSGYSVVPTNVSATKLLQKCSCPMFIDVELNDYSRPPITKNDCFFRKKSTYKIGLKTWKLKKDRSSRDRNQNRYIK